MKPSRTAQNVRQCAECLALLSGPPVPENECREAARGLGIEHFLPDPQLPLHAPKEETHGR